MTTTNHAPAGIDLDLDKLEALARAATPGPWNWAQDGTALTAYLGGRTETILWPGNAISAEAHELAPEQRRQDGRAKRSLRLGALGVRAEADAETNAAYIAAANPSTVLALIALARKAALDAPADYTVDDSELARKIMVFLGRSTTRSLEPGADPLCDRLAEKLAGWIRPSIAHPIGQVSPAIEQAAKASDARYSEGYADGWREGRADLAPEAAHAGTKAPQTTPNEPQSAHAQQAAAPAGWKMVPVEPTQEMFAAARTSANGSNTEKLLMASYWRNMLAAAPISAILPSDEKGKADDASAGGLPKQGAAHALAVSSGFAFEYEQARGVHHYRGYIEQVEKLIALGAGVATSAADAKDAELANDIDMVRGALDLCEPEDQQAFQRILALVRPERKIKQPMGPEFDLCIKCAAPAHRHPWRNCDEMVRAPADHDSAMAASRTGGAK